MKIVLVGGKTMGHVSPLINLGNALMDTIKKPKIIFYGNENSIEEEMVRKNPYFWFKRIKVIGLDRKNPFKAMKAIILYYRAYKIVLKEFKLEKPSIVISSGGFVSAPVLKACIKANVPYVLHEQNVCMGLVNKHFSKYARYTFLSFEKTRKEVKNGVLTGNPVNIKRNKQQNNYILSIGGSLGAKKLNEVVSKLDVKFITGKKDYINYIDNINAIEYSYDLPKLMNNAKVIISRAGGTTIYEALALNKPLILIPSPNVSENHQEKNARYLEKNGCALVILESELTVDLLKEKIAYLTDERIEKMKECQRKLRVNNPIEICMKKILEVVYEDILQ